MILFNNGLSGLSWQFKNVCRFHSKQPDDLLQFTYIFIRYLYLCIFDIHLSTTTITEAITHDTMDYNLSILIAHVFNTMVR